MSDFISTLDAVSLLVKKGKKQQILKLSTTMWLAYQTSPLYN